MIYIYSNEEGNSLLSTGRILSQSSDGVVEQDDGTWAKSQMSEFHFEIEHLFPRMIPEQESEMEIMLRTFLVRREC